MGIPADGQANDCNRKSHTAWRCGVLLGHRADSQTLWVQSHRMTSGWRYPGARSWYRLEAIHIVRTPLVRSSFFLASESVASLWWREDPVQVHSSAEELHLKDQIGIGRNGRGSAAATIAQLGGDQPWPTRGEREAAGTQREKTV